MSDRLCCYKQL